MTSKAFSIIYDWMISPINESYQLLRRDNILEIFMAAQYLGIKGVILTYMSFILKDDKFFFSQSRDNENLIKYIYISINKI